ncbi:hypothetical protein K443DRAFT_8959 [Laccaria amethystina LaAM-08-1]|uniref:Uncharacterized protein n=1 Tax=Laccaria amethystina LaAM-08-1 TaxID=1095629 RepID=A0A0C9X0M9_9AGAR|nr:hypothetical protein K443DRAFT_8959 [Laccaria amethystina LaAM-08-1]
MSREGSLATEKISEPVAMSQSPGAQNGKVIIPQSHGVTIQASGTDSELMSLIDGEELAKPTETPK